MQQRASPRQRRDRPDDKQQGALLSAYSQQLRLARFVVPLRRPRCSTTCPLMGSKQNSDDDRFTVGLALRDSGIDRRLGWILVEYYNRSSMELRLMPE